MCSSYWDEKQLTGFRMHSLALGTVRDRWIGAKVDSASTDGYELLGQRWVAEENSNVGGIGEVPPPRKGWKTNVRGPVGGG